MDTHGKTISEIEKKLKQTIDGTVNKTIKEAEAEKAKYMKVTENVKDLSEKINGFMTKFDTIKTEMGDNSKKFEAY
jgi:NifU-like protein involved in Fe-S cluster formation